MIGRRQAAPAALGRLLLAWGALSAAPLGAQTAISVDNAVEARTGGLEFPDGTVQTRSAGPGFAPVEATGQQACWHAGGYLVPCPGTGQDGELQRGVAWPIPRFTDNGDGTVTDHLTGLIWLRDANCLLISPATWTDGLANVNGLSTGSCGLTDGSVAGAWRLPNIRELASLLDYGQSLPPPLPPGHPLVNVQSSFYWSSSDCRGCGTPGAVSAWVISLSSSIQEAELKTETYAAWPVRNGTSAPSPAAVEDTGQRTCSDVDGDPIPCSGTGQDGELQEGVDWPTPRFTDNGNGTVTDHLTGLIWLRDESCFPGATPWTNALENANGLSDGVCGLIDGSMAGDWRLPNVKELLSLVDYSQILPALVPGHPFVGIGSGAGYWTSSSDPESPSMVFQVELLTGSVANQSKGAGWATWPVRDEQ